MQRTLIFLAALLFSIPAPAEPAPTTQSAEAEMSTPKKAMLYADRKLQHEGVDQEMKLYHAVGEKQEKMARAMAEADVALAKIESAVKEKFGQDPSQDVVHALDGKTRADIADATEEVDREKANLKWKDDDEHSVPMIKVDNVWKISVAGMIEGQEEDELTAEIDASKKLTAETLNFAKKVQDGKYKSAEDLVKSITKYMDALHSDDKPAEKPEPKDKL